MACSLCDGTGFVVWEKDAHGNALPRKATMFDKDEMEACPNCDDLPEWDPPEQYRDV